MEIGRKVIHALTRSPKDALIVESYDCDTRPAEEPGNGGDYTTSTDDSSNGLQIPPLMIECYETDTDTARLPDQHPQRMGVRHMDNRPPIMRGGHGDERKIVQIYESDSIEPTERRNVQTHQGELLQDEPRQLREGGSMGATGVMAYECEDTETRQIHQAQPTERAERDSL